MFRNLVYVTLALVWALVSTVCAADDLVGWWKLDEGSGSIISDSSGGGLDGSFTGDTPEWITGRYGNAILFNGSTGYIDLGSDPAMDITGEITVACWVRDDGFTTGWQAIFTKGLGWRLQRNNQERTLEWTCPGLTLPTPYLFGNGTIDDGEWHHVAGIYDGLRQALFIDGELDVEMEASGEMGSTSYRVMIGSIDTLTDRVWNGPIDDVRLYRYGMSRDEIRAVMRNETYPFAGHPQPLDGSMIRMISTTLTWRPAETATSHKVYFGESFDDVSDGLVEPVATAGVSLQVGTAPPYATGLTPGRTYYWRVDEINDAHPDSPWKGEVWSFRVQPAVAWDPSPADGDEYVLTDQTLTWEDGLGALFHTLYFGESFDEVNDAVTGGWMIADAIHDPGVLQTDKTYYWRVDEFSPAGTVRGDVWSFTTLPDIAVTDDPNLMLWWTLGEGIGSTAVDWSGHGHHGALRGDAQWIDGALTFDGRDDYVSAALDVPETEYAVAFWFKTTDPECGLFAVVDGDLGAGGYDRMLYLTNGDLGARIWDTEIITTTGLNLADACWHHAVHTHGASVGGQKLYVDGVLEASGVKDTSDFDWQKRINVGFSNDAARDYFDGVIEEVRIFNKTLSEDEIQQVMRGDPLLAWGPQPSRGATVDIRDATVLRWSAGDTAASHDVYFGTNQAAVAAADKAAPEFQGNQPGTTFPLDGRVEFGGGDYFWRIDEVEAAGTVHAGYVWRFTIPDYLIVDDFESYNNEVGSRVFEKWIDGLGFTQPVDTPGNGTGALVGHDIWTAGTPYTTIVETADVYGGAQAMPIYYDNTVAPFRSEADRTFTPAQNWTVEGVTTLVVHFRGHADNTGDLYVEINGTNVPYDGDPADIASRSWVTWEIDLASVGAGLTNVTALTVGIEAGQTGVLYIDEILLTGP